MKFAHSAWSSENPKNISCVNELSGRIIPYIFGAPVVSGGFTFTNVNSVVIKQIWDIQFKGCAEYNRSLRFECPEAVALS